MTDPFPTGSDSTNGSRATNPDINGHEDVQAKLPHDRSSQSLPSERLDPRTRHDIRRTFGILLATGLIIGCLTAAGVVWVMDRLELIGVPDNQQEQL